MTTAYTSSGLFGGLFSDPAIAHAFGAVAMTQHMLAFEAAWTKALCDLGLVALPDAHAALAAIAGVDAASLVTRLGIGTNRDGVPVPALVAALRAPLPPAAAATIHHGATSQDVLDTAMMLACADALDHLGLRLAGVVTRLAELADRFGSNGLMARTRMQAALPATAMLRIDAWRRPLQDHMNRLPGLRDTLAYAQVGGAIGLRDGPVGPSTRIAAQVAANLGLAVGPVWHSDRSSVVDMGHWLTLVAGSLGKLGQDIALMAQQGVDEVELTGGGGSSAMAHKQNPVTAEALVTLGRYVAGQQGILAQAMIHEQERSGAAWALEWLVLPAMAEATGAALGNAERLLAGIARIGTPV